MRTGGQRRITSYFNRVKDQGGEPMTTTEVQTATTTTEDATVTKTDGDGCSTSRTPPFSVTPATHQQTTVGESTVEPESPEADMTATFSVDADGATARLTPSAPSGLSCPTDRFVPILADARALSILPALPCAFTVGDH